MAPSISGPLLGRVCSICFLQGDGVRSGTTGAADNVGLDVASASDQSCGTAVPNTNMSVSFPSCEMGQPPLPSLLLLLLSRFSRVRLCVTP